MSSYGGAARYAPGIIFGWKIPGAFVADDDEIRWWRPYPELPDGESIN